MIKRKVFDVIIYFKVGSEGGSHHFQQEKTHNFIQKLVNDSKIELNNKKIEINNYFPDEKKVQVSINLQAAKNNINNR